MSKLQHRRDPFDDFDKRFETMQKVAIGWMVFCALFGIATLVTVVLLLLHFFG